MVDNEKNIGVTRNQEQDINEIIAENEQFNSEIDLQRNAYNFDLKNGMVHGD